MKISMSKGRVSGGGVGILRMAVKRPTRQSSATETKAESEFLTVAGLQQVDQQ